MTMLSDLLARVQANEYAPDMFCAMWHREGICQHAEGAMGGSVDAAISLFLVVLPGWQASVDTMGQAVIWYPWVEGDAPHFYAPERENDDREYTPGCALLVATLKALVAKEAA